MSINVPKCFLKVPMMGDKVIVEYYNVNKQLTFICGCASQLELLIDLIN